MGLRLWKFILLERSSYMFKKMEIINILKYLENVCLSPSWFDWTLS